MTSSQGRDRTQPIATTFAYWAGFFDGEGCIYIQKCPGGRSFNLHVFVTQTETVVLEDLANYYGGKVDNHATPANATRECYRVRLSRKGAERFLQDISPYSIGKLPQIELALEFMKHLKDNDRRGRWRDTVLAARVIDERHRMYVRMKALKKETIQ